MEVVDDVEDLLKDETNFKALVSFYLLKRTVREMRYYDRFKQPMSIFSSYYNKAASASQY